MDKLTTKSQEAIAAAIAQASSAGNPQIEPVHVLAALLEQDGGVANGLLDAVGADRTALSQRVSAALATLPGASGSSVAQPQTSRATMTMITDAGREANTLGDEYVSTEHLLVALAASTSPAGEILRAAGAAGADRDRLLAALPNVRGSAKVTSADPEGTYQALEKYGTDMTQSAREGKLDPVIGRDAEIRRVV